MSNYNMGSWKYLNGRIYVVVNQGGTLESTGHKVPWYKRLYLEIREAIGKPLNLHELRAFIA